MSVGRTAVTDTAAYFSIGPRFGATRGFMPPMVVDTASVTGTKRNGLLIFGVQKNKFLYWDSVRVQWSDMAGSSGSYIVAGDTASMLGNYIRHAGNGLTKSGQGLLVDTAAIATRARVQKGIDSVSSLVASGFTGSGTTHYIPKFTGAKALGNSIIYNNGTNVGISTTSPTQKLDVAGNIKGQSLIFSQDDQSVSITNRWSTDGTGYNIFIGGGGSIFDPEEYSPNYNVSLGNDALKNILEGESNVAIGSNALKTLQDGSNNMAIGADALLNGVSIGSNTAIGNSALNYNAYGSGNIAIGTAAGSFAYVQQTNLTNVNNSIFIGELASPANNNSAWEIVIGRGVVGNGDSTTTIGSSETKMTYLRGRLDIGTIDSISSPINVLTADVNGVVKKAAMPSGGGLSGSGTTNYIPKFSGSTSVGNSQMFDNGTSVAIGTTSPSSASILELSSTTKGLLLPRMTATQKNAISSPPVGLIIYQTDGTEGIYVNTSSGWLAIVTL